MTKRKNTMMLGALALTLGLTACGNTSGDSASSSTSTTSPSTTAAAGKVVKLKMWGGVPPESGPQAVVDNWNAKNPDIQVEYERYVNDDAGNLKLDTALLTGQSVDLFVNYTGTALKKRVDAGVALDLSSYSDYNIEQKMGSTTKDWQVNGKYYGIPTVKSTFFVWFNKEMLDQAGLKVPTSWTWKDMQDYASKLKADKRFGLVQHLESFPDSLDSALTHDGYTKKDGSSNLDNPLIGTWLDTLNTMMKDKSTPMLGEQLTTKMPVETMFLKGESAMLNAGSWIFRNSNNLKDNPRTFKIAFAPVPRLDSNEQNAIGRGGLGDFVSINAKTANKDAAWKFLKWYADGGLLPLASGGRIPASKDANVEDALKLLLGENESTYDIPSLKYVLFENKTPTFTRNLPQQVMDLRREEYEKFFLGKQDTGTTLAAMVKRHNEYMKTTK
ncbi:ABC transporter substrate-binding protein [Paenibacillus sp. Soil766]|uniref:ABC transporter substrate-binding protein n=1 Tax=Paenibacillus sp. Soil766 TaxID=1736404 RepID=UPI00070CE251|nr:extracellular solute-binding protein [Paenibacillus sp. Soil766]KRF04789.1 ABC transporter substrate-binding protein [Paenibacillus sp. Soil766]